MKNTTRLEKEKLLNQKAKVLWMTGLSGSGKTTIAFEIEKRLLEKKMLVQLFDGDIVRTGINKDLDFSIEGRTENIRRIAEISKMFINCGVIVIDSFVSPTIEIRELAKNIIGEENFIEIFVNCPLEVCEARDIKGLYRKARLGQIQDFTGIDSPYDKPDKPNIELKTDTTSVEETVDQLIKYILPLITY